MHTPGNIHVHDFILRETERRALYRMVMNAHYKLTGWDDRPDEFETPQIPCIHSRWSQADLDGTGFLQGVTRSSTVAAFVANREPKNIVVNLAHAGDVYYNHCHTGDDGMLFYINPEWRREWGGETIFYNLHGEDIAYVCEPKVNRLVCFDGSYPHAIRPFSNAAPKLRMTLTVAFTKEN